MKGLNWLFESWYGGILLGVLSTALLCFIVTKNKIEFANMYQQGVKVCEAQTKLKCNILISVEKGWGMEGFTVFVFVGSVFVIGFLFGNLGSKHEIGIKSVISTQEACKNDEGLYMIKSERDKITALCKNGNKFELKEIK